MLGIFARIFKPSATIAKWMLFVFLAALVTLGASGYLDDVRKVLDAPRLTFNLGSYSITAYGVLTTAIALILVFWTTAIIAGLLENRIESASRMKAATRALLIKISQISVYVVAFLVALDILGLDLTTLAVFGGALGIGLGFGLQKIASNFISGIILLVEKSIEQDDLVELSDGTSGFVRRTGARFTLIETFDTKEILIPNEDFITNRVTNWTLSNTKGRLEVIIGVSYKSDIKKAHSLILEAAKEHPKCSLEPEPVCFLRDFGDSSVNFILWFWLDDVTKGRAGPRSDVQFAIWDKFHENNIEIPFPQRDLHLRSSDLDRSLPDVIQN